MYGLIPSVRDCLSEMRLTVYPDSSRKEALGGAISIVNPLCLLRLWLKCIWTSYPKSLKSDRGGRQPLKLAKGSFSTNESKCYLHSR